MEEKRRNCETLEDKVKEDARENESKVWRKMERLGDVGWSKKHSTFIKALSFGTFSPCTPTSGRGSQKTLGSSPNGRVSCNTGRRKLL